MFETILMLVFGIIALVKGKFNLTINKKVADSTGRVLGIILLLGAAAGFVGGGVLQFIAFVVVIAIGFAKVEKFEDNPNATVVEE